MNRRRSRRRRRSSRRKNGLWIALAAAAAALFLSVQPGQQLVRFLTDLIDPPEWIIVLDAGHGGYDPGSVAEDGTMEKDITLQITLKTGAILEREDGVRVVYIRNSDALSWPPQEAEDLAARVRIAQQARADMLISIHLNAAEDASASGYETYIRADSEMMFDMAQQVHAEFAERGWSHERGIKSTVNAPLYVVDASGMDAMLVEAGFITNAAELALLRSEDGQQMLAECIAQGILSQLQAQNAEE